MTILARVDPKEKEVTLISIPRDTQVDIPGHGTQKINAAYAFGGASLAVDTVSELAGVPISHYAEIDFDGFKAVVDALGGIEVDVPMEINDDMAGGHVDAGPPTPMLACKRSMVNRRLSFAEAVIITTILVTAMLFVLQIKDWCFPPSWKK
ncbi:cell envelope-related function transcriptional attenuator common domain protein [Cryptobacterium sp. CAG:338]|nr:cell envelope-related function transcriptional attenuator common domain protein [Cryptobacterium sp. CAG:338]